MDESLVNHERASAARNETFASVVTAMLFVSAVAAALFFNGMHGEYFSLAMSLLLVWVAVQSWRGISIGRVLPGGRLLLLLALYVSWLLLTLLWNPIPYLGATTFWMLATPLLVVFAWYFTPVPELLWRYTWPLLLLLGVGLIVFALYQYYWLAEAPHGTFINKNSLAAMLGLLMFIAVSRVMLLSKRHRSLLVSLLTVIFFVALLIGLVGSRGVLLGLVCGMLVLVGWGGYQREARGKVWLSVAVIVVGIAVSNLPFVNVQKNLLSDRVGALSDPYAAGSGHERFLIWGQSLKMVEEKSLTGYGLGTYWQHWPQWRDPADRTSGFWAHNDFLHLWVEAGLPAVMLLLFVHVALLLSLWRILRSADVEPERKAELVALFAGLLAVAVHAQFTFNFYTLPILLVLSLMMARIARVERDACAIEGRVSPAWLRSLIPLLALLPVLYFFMVGTSLFIFEQAVAKMRQGDLPGAEQGFVRAQQLWGASDMFFYTHALLKEQQLTAIPVAEVEPRKIIFADGMQLLDRAMENNPMRPMVYFFRGRLRVQAAELGGEDWLVHAEADFKQALVYEPRYLEARLTLARILEVTDRLAEADVLLEEGMLQVYVGGGPNLLTYYQMVAVARQRSGDMNGAAEVVERYNAIVKSLLEVQRLEQTAKQ